MEGECIAAAAAARRRRAPLAAKTALSLSLPTTQKKGNTRLSGQALRARIVILATTLGLYTAGTGFLPPPPFLSSIFGEPRPPVK